MKREGKGFSERVTPLFETMMVQAPEELGEGSKIPIDPQHTPTIIQPSTSQPQKKQPRRKQRKDTEVPQPSGSTEPITDEAANEEHVPVQSNDPLLSGKDRLKLNELMELCTNLSQRVLDLENTKTSQAAEITKLKERVKKLERRNKSRTPGVKRKIQILEDEEITHRTSEEHTSCENSEKKRERLLRLKAEEQGELTIKERSKLFVELMDKKKKHFAKLRAEEIRREPPTKAQKRNQMCTYLKNMANYKHSQLKNKSFEEIQMLFDNTMKWVDSFVPMDIEVVEGSKSQAEGSSKRTGEELKSDNSKKQKIDENVEAEVDDEAERKKLMEIVPNDEVAIDAIPLATKSPIIVEWKIIKKGKMRYFQIIKADESVRRYSSMIMIVQNIDREDLETL
ncbi:hypothetical protein Tco_0218493 [Tanacetum coccineum]